MFSTEAMEGNNKHERHLIKNNSNFKNPAKDALIEDQAAPKLALFKRVPCKRGRPVKIHRGRLLKPICSRQLFD